MEAKGLPPSFAGGTWGIDLGGKEREKKGVVGTVFSPCNIPGEQTIERFAFSEKYSRETVAVRCFTFSLYGAQSIVIGLSPSFLASVSPPLSQISHSPYLSRVCISISCQKNISQEGRGV